MDPNYKIDWRLLALALLVAFVVRGGVLVAMGSSLADDPDAYRQIAVSMSDSNTFGIEGVPTAYRPPLYSTLLRLFGSQPISIAILHLAVGLLTVAGTFLLCVHVGLARWSFFAAMLVAFDPILLGQSNQVMTETVATLLVVLSMLGMVWLVECPTFRHAGLVGFFCGLAGLCRPELLAWAGLCVVTLPFVLRVARKNEEKREGESLPVRLGPADNEGKLAGASPAANERWRAIKLTLVAGVVLALTLTPWTFRNWMVFGRPIPTTTHGGYTLLLANNGPFYEYLRSGEWGSTWDADELGLRWAGEAKFSSPAEELQADRDAYREAWSNIRREPGMFLYSCLVRAGRLWGLVPHQGPRVVRYAIGLWYLALYALALVSVIAIWRKKTTCTHVGRAIWLYGGVLAVSTTAVHTVFWSNMRMRAPLIPLLALVATAGVAGLVQKWRSDRSSKREV